MNFIVSAPTQFFVIVLVLIISISSPFPVLILSSFLFLAVIANIVRVNPVQPGILFFIFVYHWLQIATTPFAAWLGGISINEMSMSSFGVFTIWICFIGLVFLGLGYSYWIRKLELPSIEQLRIEIESFSFNKILFLYLLLFVLNIYIRIFAFYYPGITQPLLRVAELKVVFLYLLIYFVYLTKRHLLTLLVVIIIEFIFGFTGYFSGFKNIIFYLIIAAIPLISRITFSRIIIGGTGVYAIFILALSWQAIKGEYRSFLNQGTNTQTVKVDPAASLKKVKDLFANLDAETRDRTTFAFLNRIAYTKYIANSMEYVPSYKAHQNGALWFENVSFALIPRFINPNKGIKDDSQKVIEYTGIRVASRLEGASISLGYFGDCYIDFGFLGMMPFLFLIGWFIGSGFYFFYTKLNSLFVFKYAYLNVIFFSFYNFETDGTTLVGVLILNTIYYFIILKVILSPATKFLRLNL